MQKVTWNEFDNARRLLAMEIKAYATKFQNIYAVPRGGYVLGVCLSHSLGIPMISDENKINEHTLIVDDISDTGKTLQKYKNNKIATMHFHQQTLTMPDFYVFEKKDDWLVYPWEV